MPTLFLESSRIFFLTWLFWNFTTICFSVDLFLSIIPDLSNLQAGVLHFLKIFLNCVLKTSSYVLSLSRMPTSWALHLLDWASDFFCFIPFFSLCHFLIEFFNHTLQSFYLVFHSCLHVVTSSKLVRLSFAKCCFFIVPRSWHSQKKNLCCLKRLTVGTVSASSRFKNFFHWVIVHIPQNSPF